MSRGSRQNWDEESCTLGGAGDARLPTAAATEGVAPGAWLCSRKLNWTGCDRATARTRQNRRRRGPAQTIHPKMMEILGQASAIADHPGGGCSRLANDGSFPGH